MSEDESFANRTCPYCGMKLKDRPYWRHIETEHPDEYANDKSSWIQLFKDYTAMGMDAKNSIQVICELFNQTPDDIEDFLKSNGILE